MLGQLADAGNTTTLAHYLDVLGKAYLLSGLELFSKEHVLNAGYQVVALEIKSGRPGRVSGLSAFRKAFPESKAFIVGANGIPLEDFSRSSPHDLLLS